MLALAVRSRVAAAETAGRRVKDGRLHDQAEVGALR